MAISRLFVSKVEAPAWSLVGLGLIGLATLGIISWLLWFQFSPSVIEGISGRNTAGLQFSIKPKNGSTWSVTEAGNEVSTVQMDPDTSGAYQFKVLTSVKPALYVGMKFTVQLVGSGALVCPECINGGAKNTSLPVHWSLTKQ